MRKTRSTSDTSSHGGSRSRLGSYGSGSSLTSGGGGGGGSGSDSKSGGDGGGLQAMVTGTGLGIGGQPVKFSTPTSSTPSSRRSGGRAHGSGSRSSRSTDSNTGAGGGGGGGGAGATAASGGLVRRVRPGAPASAHQRPPRTRALPRRNSRGRSDPGSSPKDGDDGAGGGIVGSHMHVRGGRSASASPHDHHGHHHHHHGHGQKKHRAHSVGPRLHTVTDAAEVAALPARVPGSSRGSGSSSSADRPSVSQLYKVSMDATLPGDSPHAAMVATKLEYEDDDHHKRHNYRYGSDGQGGMARIAHNGAAVRDSATTVATDIDVEGSDVLGCVGLLFGNCSCSHMHTPRRALPPPYTDEMDTQFQKYLGGAEPQPAVYHAYSGSGAAAADTHGNPTLNKHRQNHRYVVEPKGYVSVTGSGAGGGAGAAVRGALYCVSVLCVSSLRHLFLLTTCAWQSWHRTWLLQPCPSLIWRCPARVAP